ncbi:uncharacterized protein PFL1_02282 [Pseudozyma flocculosa PF-1]|uniref:Related to cop9 signalosome complex subunit 7a n=1 Tax=Pseudozyma flocculosa TaxID=84751 RepID=A0A5C3F5Y6_9BASI|nr:uncharacterized protein PFL1_02282 [Pseudozyma flocculosa PF-1]EPQ30166.1 hypothetical protein PFL1_02282 [Pseudozyma flocculosa PF-1]SPO39908.1 related to cop9 signalosome complex subunit 7a [Pseudozyma flocculosa]
MAAPAPAPSTAGASAAPSGSGSKLEPFLILARSTKPRGAAAAKLVQQVTEANDVYAFAELFDVPGVAELRTSEEYAHFYRLLELFAYGTLPDYTASPSSFPELTAAQLLKLRQLTLVSLASGTRVLPYATLFASLNLATEDMRELEDLIIDSIYAGLVGGKLNQIRSRFEVDAVIGRDVRGPAEIDALLTQLQGWGGRADGVLKSLEAKIERIRAQEAAGAAVRHEHNQALFLALQQAQEGAGGKGQRAAWAGADGMDLDGWDDQAAGGRGGSRKKIGSGASSSTQRNKRSRA